MKKRDRDAEETARVISKVIDDHVRSNVTVRSVRPTVRALVRQAVERQRRIDAQIAEQLGAVAVARAIRSGRHA